MIAPNIAIQFGRRVLCGFSQCAFQANEITGALFIAAVAVFNWRMAIFYVISGVIATLVARALNGNKELLDLGLYQFNSALMGLALGNFFQPNAILWLYMVVLAAVTAAVTVAWSKLTRLPFLAAPFILVLWAMWPFAQYLGLAKVDVRRLLLMHRWFGERQRYQRLAPRYLRQAFLAVFSSWSVCSSAIGVTPSLQRLAPLRRLLLRSKPGAPGTAINSGFIGFNGVLAALAAYIVVAADLRLVALGALLSTWLASYVYRGAPVPVLASGFVLAVWLILFLGWANPWFAGKAVKDGISRPNS